MDLLKIYELGKLLPIGFSIRKDKEKLEFVDFQYTSKEVMSATIVFFLMTVIAAFVFYLYLPLASQTVFFLGSIVTILVYFYPTQIYYSKSIMDYNEEMLRAVMRLSNYILMNTSIEYAFIETQKQLKGPLNREFRDIIIKLTRKQKVTLGAVLEGYIGHWNEINPAFVKSLRLLQTAALASEEDKAMVIEEVIETLMLDYTTLAKRSIESVSNKTKNLISFGVLIPLTSLMLLPILSIFMPHLLQPSVLIFVYNILFPTGLLLMAMNFSKERVQVDTINIKESPFYKEINPKIYLFCILIIIAFIIPAVFHVLSMDMTSQASAEKEYSFYAVFISWLPSLGLALAAYIFSSYYIKNYTKIWEDVWNTEQDLPHLFEVFSTYLTLNMSIEKIVPIVVDDYATHGYSNHPVVSIFKKINRGLIISKKNINSLIETTLHRYCPSKKVSNLLNQVITFTETSQESSAKAAKVIRKQLIEIQKLDDYMKTLLADTVGLINITTLLLAPLLSAIAILMSLALVQSLTYIATQLEFIHTSLAPGSTGGLELVDITQILPPTILEIVVGIYLLEMILVLSIFSTNIKIGTDRFQTAKTINSNIIGFVIYSILLLGGHFVIIELFMKGVFA